MRKPENVTVYKVYRNQELQKVWTAEYLGEENGELLFKVNGKDISRVKPECFPMNVWTENDGKVKMKSKFV